MHFGFAKLHNIQLAETIVKIEVKLIVSGQYARILFGNHRVNDRELDSRYRYVQHKS